MKAKYLLIGLLLLGACSREKVCDCVPPYQEKYLKATVVIAKDISCGLPVLNFNEDSARAKLLLKPESLSYVAKSLPETLAINGKELYVKVTLLPTDEDFPCLAIGPGFPKLKVIDAQPR